MTSWSVGSSRPTWPISAAASTSSCLATRSCISARSKWCCTPLLARCGPAGCSSSRWRRLTRIKQVTFCTRTGGMPTPARTWKRSWRLRASGSTFFRPSYAWRAGARSLDTRFARSFQSRRTTRGEQPVARAMEIVTPLGEDALLFRSMHVREELSRVAEYQLELLSTRNDIEIDEVLDKNITVKLTLTDGTLRHFNGYITKFAQSGGTGRYYR